MVAIPLKAARFAYARNAGRLTWASLKWRTSGLLSIDEIKAGNKPVAFFVGVCSVLIDHDSWIYLGHWTFAQSGHDPAVYIEG